VSPDCFTGTILISLPDESKDDVGDHAHDWGDDQHHQELAHGCVPSQNSVNLTLRFSSGPVETAGTLDTTRRNERMVSPRPPAGFGLPAPKRGPLVRRREVGAIPSPAGQGKNRVGNYADTVRTRCDGGGRCHFAIVG